METARSAVKMPNEIRLGTSHTADARKAMQSVSVVTKIAEMARRYAHRIRSRIELRCDGARGTRY